MPEIPVMWEAKIGGLWSSQCLHKKEDPIQKITKAQRVRGVVQEVECLPGNLEALSSNPGTAIIIIGIIKNNAHSFKGREISSH
jgi:hypothetical protein